ncbi:MAG: hypothetical protein ABSF29_07220 [Tepidisphaeraceae bacterium]
MTENHSHPILALVRDLMFSGRIAAEARAAGAACKIVRDPTKLPADGRLLIVDLNLAGAIDAAAEWQKGGGTVVAFVAHTDEHIISQAREAGIQRVLARGRFVQILPELLRQGLPS